MEFLFPRSRDILSSESLIQVVSALLTTLAHRLKPVDCGHPVPKITSCGSYSITRHIATLTRNMHEWRCPLSEYLH